MDDVQNYRRCRQRAFTAQSPDQKTIWISQVGDLTSKIHLLTWISLNPTDGSTWLVWTDSRKTKSHRKLVWTNTKNCWMLLMLKIGYQCALWKIRCCSSLVDWKRAMVLPIYHGGVPSYHEGGSPFSAANSAIGIKGWIKLLQHQKFKIRQLQLLITKVL